MFSRVTVGGEQSPTDPTPNEAPPPSTSDPTLPTGEATPPTPSAEPPKGLELPEPPKPTDVLARIVNGEPVSAEDLKAAGLSDAQIKAYHDNLKKVGEANAQSLYALAGGANEYATIQKWAAGALTTEERKAFNEAVKSGNPHLASLAVRGLVDRYKAENGAPPNLVRGERVSDAARPFTTQKEMVAAMRDPRYDRDGAYRSEVARRLMVTDLGKLGG